MTINLEIAFLRLVVYNVFCDYRLQYFTLMVIKKVPPQIGVIWVDCVLELVFDASACSRL